MRKTISGKRVVFSRIYLAGFDFKLTKTSQKGKSYGHWENPQVETVIDPTAAEKVYAFE